MRSFSLTDGSVSSYEVDANGDPIPSTRRTFIDGVTGAQGAAIDPLTGDFLFSTYGGSRRDRARSYSALSPEPGTWVLVALGLAMLGAGVRSGIRPSLASAGQRGRAGEAQTLHGEAAHPSLSATSGKRARSA